ncbi:MAG: HPr(Ser) kinase/phosphatase [Clostridia bacterium]|nr:HPr(Ser) kinase/phosphatase [Clostridia bacterium]MBR6335157.1 HPr(Ser) kinase/phosphatase [Clostridia bacterium]
MSAEYSVSLDKVVKELSLTVIYAPEDISNIYIKSQDVNRPGLMLAGYEEYFDNRRVQFMGLAELEFAKSLGEEESLKRMEYFFSKKPALVIFTRGLEIEPSILVFAEKYGVPVVSSNDSTSGCMSATISYLGVELAPRITRHGVLVEVYGEGVLLLGDSGVGKSETALELINRGHRLIADDAVEIRRTTNKTLVGSAPDNIRHFIELRGVGVLNFRRLFGIGAVKMTEKIDMVIQLELWDNEKSYDRMGLENEYMEILGIEVPVCVVPVKPGRNLSIIIEAAAMNNRQKKMGYNSARELLEKLGTEYDMEQEKKVLDFWHDY